MLYSNYFRIQEGIADYIPSLDQGLAVLTNSTVVILKEELDKILKEKTIKILDKDETQVDSSRN